MRLRLIALTLEEWSYLYKAHLHGLNLAHLYKEMVYPLPPSQMREVGFKASLLAALEVWREVFFISGDV